MLPRGIPRGVLRVLEHPISSSSLLGLKLASLQPSASAAVIEPLRSYSTHTVIDLKLASNG